MQAVITGDIVNSTRLTPKEEKKMFRSIGLILEPYQHEFYRGDSFQVLLKDATHALKIALLCRTIAISLARENENATFDVRMSIGIGKVTTVVKSLSIAKGEAFILSGRAFDTLAATNKRLAITTGNMLATEGLVVIADYLNAIFNVMTAKQAAVIFELLKGQTQLIVARKLRKSRSTINQHVNAGRWEEIENLMLHFENIIKQLS